MKRPMLIDYRVATMNAISKWKSSKATFYVCSNENEIFQNEKIGRQPEAF